jgi:phage gp36-like protein
MRAIKQPGEVLTFTYDFSDDLAGATISSIAAGPTSTPRGTGANMTVSGAASISADSRSVQVKWQGGADGETYATVVSVNDTAGERHERDGEILVLERGFTVPTGIVSRYLTADEYVERYGQAETVRLTDEVRANIVDKAKLEQPLKDATDLADSYIGTRYTTPLVSTPRVVKSIVGALTREALHKTRPTPEVTAAADRARQQLRYIAAGRMTLPVEQGDEVPVIGGNRYAETSGDGSTTFRDAVAGFTVGGAGCVANWRR